MQMAHGQARGVPVVCSILATSLACLGCSEGSMGEIESNSGAWLIGLSARSGVVLWDGDAGGKWHLTVMLMLGVLVLWMLLGWTLSNGNFRHDHGYFE